MNNKKYLSEQIKIISRQLGFHKTGIAQAKVLPNSAHLMDWISEGRHGGMNWMENYLEKRLDVTALYPEARSVISVAHNYFTPHKHSRDKSAGKISRYAWGKDYHKIIKKKLKELLREIKKLDDSIDGRLFVDTAPIQDKLWAEAAGIGWQGKNTNILTREMGSWIFLGELVIDKDLEYDRPVADHCGSCTACLDACPTDALEPYKIDARKCISYLTIEHWDKPIPGEFAGKLENWIFGCDICQDVCPWNSFAEETDEDEYQPGEGNIQPTLKEIGLLTEDEFKKRFKKSPVSRAKHNNFLRNVRTVMKNSSGESR